MALKRAFNLIALAILCLDFRVTAVEAMTYRMTVRSLPESGGRCVSANQQFAESAPVFAWDCNGTNFAQTLTYDDETQELKFGANCIEILGQGDDQDAVGVGTCSGAITQRWSMVATRDNYQIVGANRLCLDIGNGEAANGTRLHLSKCSPDDTAELWTLFQASNPPQPAQSTSPATNSTRSIIERFGLIGTFAEDCAKGPSDSNEYIVHRLVDDEHVERDQMKSPNVRSYTASVEKAEELTSNDVAMEISITETVIKQIKDWRIHLVTRINRNRMRLMESTPLTGPSAGHANIVDGKAVNGGGETRWLTKCK